MNHRTWSLSPFILRTLFIVAALVAAAVAAPGMRAANLLDADSSATAISSSANPSALGQSVTLTAQVTRTGAGATPTGTVAFKDESATLPGCGSVSLNGSARATCTLATLSGGAHSITAVYSGGGGLPGSTSPVLTQAVEKAGAAASVTSHTPNPSIVGQPITVGFKVTPASVGGFVPTGNVTVSDGTDSCTAPISAGSCTLKPTSAGAKALTASYGGDGNFNSLLSASGLAHTVGKANTTTTIISHTPDPSVVGGTVTISFQVTVNPPGSGTPTGLVTVTAGSSNCVGAVGHAACTLLFTSPGTKVFTAAYGGDANFNPSSTATGSSHTVIKADTATTITTDTPDPSVVGQTVPIHFSVAASAPGTGTPTGNVTVTDGTISCTATAAAGSCNLTFTSVGSKSLTASYVGDSNYNTSSTAAPTAHTVNKADATVMITSHLPQPSVVGQAVAVGFAVSASAPGGGTPTGNVTVTDGTISCTATVAVGTCNLTFGTQGLKTLNATYAGDTNYNTSSTLTGTPHSVKTATTVTITGHTPNPSTVGQAVAVPFTVASVPPGGSPTGNVTVSDGVSSCTATVAAGTCNITLMTAGARSLTATYAGDATFSGSTSPAVVQTVNKANTTTAITAHIPNPVSTWQVVTISFHVTVTPPGSGAPTGTVTVNAGEVTCTAAAGHGDCTVAFKTPGSKVLTATYSGDANYNASTSSPVGHTVNRANTVTTIISQSPEPSDAGQSVHVQFSVSPEMTIGGVPTGSVLVTDGVDACAGTAEGGACDIVLNTVGLRTLQATYMGDASFNGSPSPKVYHNVNEAPPAEVPEADTLLLMGAGLSGIAAWLGRRWRQARAGRR